MEAFEQSFMGFEPVEKSAPPIESFMYTNRVKLNIQPMVVSANQNARERKKKYWLTHSFNKSFTFPKLRWMLRISLGCSVTVRISQYAS